MSDLAKKLAGLKKADLIALVEGLSEGVAAAAPQQKAALPPLHVKWSEKAGMAFVTDNRPMFAGGEQGKYSRTPKVWFRPIKDGVPAEKGGSRVHIDVVRYLSDPANKAAIDALIADQVAFTEKNGGHSPSGE